MSRFSGNRFSVCRFFSGKFGRGRFGSSAVERIIRATLSPVMSNLTEGETLSDVPNFADMIALGNFAPADGVTGVTIDGVTLTTIGVADQSTAAVAGDDAGFTVTVDYTQDGEAKTQVFNAGIRRVRYIDPVAAGGLPDLSLFVGGDPVVVDVASDFTGGGITYALAPTSAALPAGAVLSGAGQLTIAPSAAFSASTIIIRGTDPDGDFDDTAFGLTVTLPQISTDTVPVMGELLNGADVSTEAGTDGTYSSNVPDETVSASVSYERANGEAFSGEVAAGDILRKRVDLTGSEGTMATVFSEAITVQILPQVLSVSAGEVSGLNMPLTLDVDGAPDVTYAIGDFALVGDGSPLLNRNLAAGGENIVENSIANAGTWSTSGLDVSTADLSLDAMNLMPGMTFTAGTQNWNRVFTRGVVAGNPEMTVPYVIAFYYREGSSGEARLIMRNPGASSENILLGPVGDIEPDTLTIGDVTVLEQATDGVNHVCFVQFTPNFEGLCLFGIGSNQEREDIVVLGISGNQGTEPISFIETGASPVTRPAAITSDTIPAAQDGVFEVSLPENLDGTFSVLATSDGNPAVVADGPFPVNTVVVNNVAPTIDAAPTVSGTYVEGETITFTVGNASGTPTPDEEFTLYRDNDVLLEDVALTGPNIYEHTLTSADVGLTLGFGHEATNSEGTVDRRSPGTPVIASNNNAPVAVDDNGLTTPFETVLDIDVLANDTDADPGDTLALTGTPTATSGTVAYVGGLLRFTPATGFDGDVTLTYEVTDGTDTDTGSVSVTVEAEVSNTIALNSASLTRLPDDSLDLTFDATYDGAGSLDGEMTLLDGTGGSAVEVDTFDISAASFNVTGLFTADINPGDFLSFRILEDGTAVVSNAIELEVPAENPVSNWDIEDSFDTDGLLASSSDWEAVSGGAMANVSSGLLTFSKPGSDTIHNHTYLTPLGRNVEVEATLSSEAGSSSRRIAVYGRATQGQPGASGGGFGVYLRLNTQELEVRVGPASLLRVNFSAITEADLTDLSNNPTFGIKISGERTGTGVSLTPTFRGIDLTSAAVLFEDSYNGGENPQGNLPAISGQNSGSSDQVVISGFRARNI